MKNFSAFRGILFDLDGVLYVDNQALDGAVAAVENIRANGIPCRFVTNTSTLSLASLAQKINALGFHIPQHEIMSAPQAAVLYLREQSDPVCRLLLSDEVKKDFAEFRQAPFQSTESKVDYIVIGDIGNAWSYSLLNELFQNLLNGAKLIAIHKNRFWQTGGGLQMDIGGFVHALEYASGTTAMLIGKPSPHFFHSALESLGLPPEVTRSQVAMVGDDIDADVGGAQRAGLSGILVKTGKYRQAYAEASLVKPDFVVDSIKNLPELLGLVF